MAVERATLPGSPKASVGHREEPRREERERHREQRRIVVGEQRSGEMEYGDPGGQHPGLHGTDGFGLRGGGWLGQCICN